MSKTFYHSRVIFVDYGNEDNSTTQNIDSWSRKSSDDLKLLRQNLRRHSRELQGYD